MCDKIIMPFSFVFVVVYVVSGVKPGGVAVLKRKDRFIYYLVCVYIIMFVCVRVEGGKKEKNKKDYGDYNGLTLILGD